MAVTEKLPEVLKTMANNCKLWRKYTHRVAINWKQINSTKQQQIHFYGKEITFFLNISNNYLSDTNNCNTQIRLYDANNKNG